MTPHIIVAPNSFKETMDARTAGRRAIAEGVRRALPDARVECIPLADGGAGTVAALTADRGRVVAREVTGPLGDHVRAEFGLLDEGRTAVVELSAASGLHLLAPEERDPRRTTTYGAGELIRAALDAGANRIIVGVGGSATVDGGCGALQALGVRFVDASGAQIVDLLCGGLLERIARIDASAAEPRARRARIEVACDVTNPLCGPQGAAPTFGPQKGAAPDDVRTLSRGLEHLARLFARDLRTEVADLPHAGAAGGLPAGLHAAFGATLLSGIDLILDAVGFAERIRGADLVITGEGRLDATTRHGKAVSGVVRCATAASIPVIALVGSADDSAGELLTQFAGVYSLTSEGTTRELAMARAPQLLADLAERAIRQWAAAKG